MIDEGKIEEAASEITEKYTLVNSLEHSENLCKCLFKEGVHWAIKEFLKDLWHDASEEPTHRAECLLFVHYEYEDASEDNYCEYTTATWLCNGWSEDHLPSDADVKIEKWCYISDILPQEGDKQ